MRFATLVARNLLRRKVRTALTVAGLAIGIAAVVALLGIAWGFERSFLKIYESKQIDLVVVRAGVSERLTSNLDEKVGDKLRRIKGVRLPGRVADRCRLVRGGEPGQRPGQRLGAGERAVPRFSRPEGTGVAGG